MRTSTRNANGPASDVLTSETHAADIVFDGFEHTYYTALRGAVPHTGLDKASRGGSEARLSDSR